MAEDKKYIIKISGNLIKVTPEVYGEYHRMDRYARYQEERDLQHGKTLYSNLDTAEIQGEELIPDQNAASTEDAAIARILYAKLHRCLNMLPEADRALIQALFFDEMSLRQLSERENIPVMTLQNRKAKAIQRLRKIFLKK